MSTQPGDYDARIGNIIERKSSKGNPMWELDVVLEPGRAKVKDFLVLTESAAWKLARFFDSIGMAVDDGEDIDADDLIGRKGRVRIAIEEYNGRKQLKVTDWLPPQPTEPETDTDSDEVL